MKKINPVEIIVDLFELRATCLTPKLEDDLYERVSYDYHYHILSQAITNLIHKYKITSREIEEEIRTRQNIAKEKKFREYEKHFPYKKNNF